MNLFLVCFISGASLLLSFILFFHPLRQNVIANRWLSFFVFIISCAFINTYFIKTEVNSPNSLIFKCLSSLQFLLSPSLFISILFFVKPTKVFNKLDWIHFVPFAIYTILEHLLFLGKESISLVVLFRVNTNVSFLVRDLLPFQTLFYLILSYIALAKHKTRLKLVSSSIDRINLDWLLQFLFILLLTILIWINDALFELPFLTAATSYVYAGSIFFLAYFSVQQKTIFSFKEKDIQEISEVVETTVERQKRLNIDQITHLSVKLISLMEVDRLFLDNDLDLPTVANKLGISIHEASFLINEITKDNFYTFINKYRVDEAKKLLTSSRMEELNILGIAFASGFNSKTTFNITFKKMVGVSPSQYIKAQKK